MSTNEQSGRVLGRVAFEHALREDRIIRGRNRPCKFMAMPGGCTFGERCFYLHDRALWEVERSARTHVPSEDQVAESVQQLDADTVAVRLEQARQRVREITNEAVDAEVAVAANVQSTADDEAQRTHRPSRDEVQEAVEALGLGTRLLAAEIKPMLEEVHPEWAISRRHVKRALTSAFWRRCLPAKATAKEEKEAEAKKEAEAQAEAEAAAPQYPMLGFNYSHEAEASAPQLSLSALKRKYNRNANGLIECTDSNDFFRLAAAEESVAYTNERVGTQTPCPKCRATNYYEMWTMWVPYYGSDGFYSCCGYKYDEKDGYI